MLAFRYSLFGWLVGDCSVQIMIRDMPFYGISLDASLASKEKRKRAKQHLILIGMGLLTILPVYGIIDNLT